MFKFSADQAAPMCQNSTYYNFSSILNTTVAMTNTYLYGNAYNPDYQQDLLGALNITSTSDDYKSLMYGSSSGINTEMDNAQGNIYS